MPRIPQVYDRIDYCYPHKEVIVDNSNVDIKLKLLQEKLNEEIDKKQNKLIAGENITIENNVISAFIDPQPVPPEPPVGYFSVFIYDGHEPLEED